MQFYQGPSRRVLRRFQSDTNITIDGIVDHEEERGLFVKQSFELEQVLNPGGEEFNMGNMWYLAYEDDFNVQVGGRTPFAGEHTITDRLLLNKTFRNLTFSPEGCNNFLTVDSNSTTRLAPLLCADSTYTNVTRPPVITTNGAAHQADVFVQMGAYNRFWFGAVDDMSTHPQVTNRVGIAPYSLGDYAADVSQAAGAGNHEVYTVFGFDPQDIPHTQPLRHHDDNILLGQQGVAGSTTGLITWRYDTINDRYYTNPFQVTFPYPTNQSNVMGTFMVPSMHTTSITDMQPFNYFFVNDPATNPRTDVPGPAEILAAGVLNETYNTYDFVRVPLSRTYVVAEPTTYMFVPAFRIANGNGYRSIGRPRRYALDSAATTIQPWLPLNATPMSTLVGLGTDLLSQVPFWANFQNLRGERQHVGENALFDYVKVGHLGVVTVGGVVDQNPLFTLQFMAQNTLPAAFQTQMDVIYQAVVIQRNAVGAANTFNAADKEVMFLYKDTQTDYYGYFRVKLDELNTFRAANGGFNQNNFGNKVANPANFRLGLWQADRQVQIELEPDRNGKRLKQNMSPFRSEAAFETAHRLIVGRGNAEILASQTSESFENTVINAAALSGKPFDLRSAYNFMRSDYDYGAQADRPALQLPYRAANGSLSANTLAFYQQNRFELFIPVQREVPNTLVAPSTITVECCEPFFGYCSGSSQLECQHPFDTRRLGKNYPIFLQDMRYSYSRDASNIVTHGYKADTHNSLVVTGVSPPVFTSISEKLPGVRQDNKELMKIAEVTPTFDVYNATFSDSPGAETIPTIEIETRSGMFEYLFMYITYPQQAIYSFPLSDPVIQSLRFKVRGRENLFVRTLDGDDLERLSRENSHKLCRWRDWHNEGQGILLSLADVGLTEEISYPQRDRIQLEITCLTKSTPVSAIALPLDLQFTVVVVRRNQLFKGDHTGTRFVFLNENR